jgi:hypothetical protein
MVTGLNWDWGEVEQVKPQNSLQRVTKLTMRLND